MLRGMVKSRRELVELYRRAHRQDLVDKEEAEIAVIESFLPQQMDDAAMAQAIDAAVAETGASQHQGDGQGDGRAAGEARRHAGHGQGRADGEGAAVVRQDRRRHSKGLPLPLREGAGGRGARPRGHGCSHPSPHPPPPRGGGEGELMALSPAFLEELRARTPLAAVVGAAGEARPVRAADEGLLPVP